MQWEETVHQESMGGEVRLYLKAGPAMCFAGPMQCGNTGLIQQVFRKFQDGDDSRALSQVQGSAKCGAQCECSGHVAIKP